MDYKIEGDDLCIRIPLAALSGVVEANSYKVIDREALALAVGRELCECEDTGEDFYLNRTLDAALERVIESADPAIEYKDRV